MACGYASTRTTFTLDDDLVQCTRDLNTDISAAAREGVAAAVRTALVKSDRVAYQRIPEAADEFWQTAQA